MQGRWLIDIFFIGIFNRYMDKKKSLKVEDQYIHGFRNTPEGGVLILTFNYHFIQLIHTARSFEVDTTFKCAYGELNEWEIVIWHAGENRCKSHHLHCCYE